MADEIPQWAFDRVDDLSGEDFRHRTDFLGCHAAFARYIAEHEQPPVDPLLLEAREICARWAEEGGSAILAMRYRSGELDAVNDVLRALAALKRGIEIAAQQGADQ